MSRLWPRGVAGQLILALLLALVAAQLVTWWIFADERRLALETIRREQILEQIPSLVAVLRDTPAEAHAAILQAASNRRTRFELAAQSAVRAGVAEADNPVARALAAELGPLAGAVLVDLRPRRAEPPDRRARAEGRERPGERREARRGPPFLVLAVGVELGEGRWLNARAAVGPPAPRLGGPYLAMLAMVAASVVAVVILIVRRVTRPLTALAAAAERLGRGESGAPLAEAGPDEVRRATAAFNAMQARLRRFVEDRTNMLAAIGHDLRTPITALRLRAELIEDEATRAPIVASLEEMRRMVEATLAFARDEAASEPTRTVDLRALADAVADDSAALGGAVTTLPGEPVTIPCRPLALKRALRNLVDNALRYAGAAEIAIERRGGEVALAVLDRGPGIPAAMLERVFEPFVRLEGSRSQETGGVGLGLAIARSIARAHGGDLTLANRSGAGLAATLLLPAAGARGAV